MSGSTCRAHRVMEMGPIGADFTSGGQSPDSSTTMSTFRQEKADRDDRGIILDPAFHRETSRSFYRLPFRRLYGHDDMSIAFGAHDPHGGPRSDPWSVGDYVDPLGPDGDGSGVPEIRYRNPLLADEIGAGRS